mmetsp:Transcript_22718/g.73056  ORF Transcript_22718/g.73056 Transcript_22718/m.73056 type:complete len:493 (+) Transcript_22718:67-1545(+)
MYIIERRRTICGARQGDKSSSLGHHFDVRRRDAVVGGGGWSFLCCCRGGGGGVLGRARPGEDEGPGEGVEERQGREGRGEGEAASALSDLLPLVPGEEEDRREDHFANATGGDEDAAEGRGEVELGLHPREGDGVDGAVGGAEEEDEGEEDQMASSHSRSGEAEAGGGGDEGDDEDEAVRGVVVFFLFAAAAEELRRSDAADEEGEPEGRGESEGRRRGEAEGEVADGGEQSAGALFGTDVDEDRRAGRDREVEAYRSFAPLGGGDVEVTTTKCAPRQTEERRPEDGAGGRNFTEGDEASASEERRQGRRSGETAHAEGRVGDGHVRGLAAVRRTPKDGHVPHGIEDTHGSGDARRRERELARRRRDEVHRVSPEPRGQHGDAHQPMGAAVTEEVAGHTTEQRRYAIRHAARSVHLPELRRARTDTLCEPLELRPGQRHPRPDEQKAQGVHHQAKLPSSGRSGRRSRHGRPKSRRNARRPADHNNTTALKRR